MALRLDRGETDFVNDGGKKCRNDLESRPDYGQHGKTGRGKGERIHSSKV